MILSRTMRETDYPELVQEGGVLMSMQNVTNLWPASLQRNSLWEYALALKATRDVLGNRADLKVADYGYDLGLPPLLLWMGWDLTMIEIWPRFKEEENYMLEHLTRVKERRMACAHDRVDFVPRKFRSNGLPEMHSFDAVYCTSMLAKLGEVELAFEDMCSLVKLGGMLFLTTNEEDRELSIRQFNELLYLKLYSIAVSKGFKWAGGETDYDWANRENSFTSMVLEKKGEIG